MKQNGVLVTLLVDDYDSAIEFYVNTLGLFEIVADTQVSKTSRYVCISLKDFVSSFMLRLHVPTSQESKQVIGVQCGNDVLMTLPVADIRSLHSKLFEHGAIVDPEVEWVPYGGGACVVDPFGNRLSLFQHFVSRFESD